MPQSSCAAFDRCSGTLSQAWTRSRRTARDGGGATNKGPLFFAHHALEAAAARLDRALRLRPDPMREINAAQRRVELAANALSLADPNRPLRAGYARIVTDADLVVSHAAELRRGSAVRILFADGFAAAEVQEITMNTESSETGEQMP